jgi:hypothetical protein
VDEVDAALASAGSPDPSLPVPQPAAVARPAPEPTQPRGPRDEDRGTTTVPRSRPATSPRPELQPSTRPTPRPKITATGRSEMDGRRITPTDAASRHRASLAPSPCVGGAVCPGILAATAGPPRSSSAPAAPTSPPPPLRPATTGDKRPQESRYEMLNDENY